MYRIFALCLTGFAVSAVSLARAPLAWSDSFPKVEILDRAFPVGGGMFAYTEYELSGEPMVEGLGLDLDILDEDRANKPTAFDYTGGIEFYEYSEHAMYALDYESRLGVHIVNGPLNAKAGGTAQSLGSRFIDLCAAAGWDPAELPLNLYPISIPIDRALPVLGQKVDVTPVNYSTVDILTHKGNQRTVNTFIPAYLRDYRSLGWQSASPKSMDVSPTAIAGALLKDVVWAQDFVGAMHDVTSEEEVEATSSTMDRDGEYRFGGDSKDGINGMILTEISWDRLLMLRDRFGYDGKSLGVRIGPDYDANEHPVWFPEKINAELEEKNGANALGKLTVKDGGSSLRSTWMMLWALGETYGYTDQRPANKVQNLSFLAAFDGAPFASAPKENLDLDPGKHVRADDLFSLAQTLSGMVFKNLKTLHFDEKAGTLVDRWDDGKMGRKVTAFDAAYALVALDVYQRALDALPVGYASASKGAPLGTNESKQALALMNKQADFIITRMIGKNGLVADSYTLGQGASGRYSLGAQFAAIRGLSAAFVASGNEAYRTAARKIYAAVDGHMFDDSAGLFNPNPGRAFEVDSWTTGAVSGGVRALLQVVNDRESEVHVPAMSRAVLADRYTRWYQVVARGMQLSEWPTDTGEHLVENDRTGDINENGIKSVTFSGGRYGFAPVMAARVSVSRP